MTTTKSLQSQLGNTDAPAGVSKVAAGTAIGRVVQAYIKGGVLARNVVLENVKLAIQQSLQNNPQAMQDVRAYSNGKDIKARAVQAGVLALRGVTALVGAVDGDDCRITPVQYTVKGKKLTDAVNAPAREEIAQKRDTLYQTFVNAFEAAFVADEQQRKAAKLQKDATKQAEQAAAAALTAINTPVNDDTPSIEGVTVTHHAEELTIDQQASNAASALLSGMLSDDAAATLMDAALRIIAQRAAAAEPQAAAMH